jgi:N-methylhydantoinase A/oxoprolinase/acetone carboxylase beta subunit
VELDHINVAMDDTAIPVHLEPALPLLPTAAGGDFPARSLREARFGGAWLETEVLRGETPAGTNANGPCIFELPEATFVLPPGWAATVDEAGTIVASRSG